MRKKGMNMTGILMLSLIGTVIGVLLCTILLFYQTYQSSLIRSAQTSGRQTIAQVSNTVDEYLKDMNGVMALLADSLEDEQLDREEFFHTFLQIRPDVVAATTYNETGELLNCYCLNHEPREPVYRNLSLNGEILAQYREGYVSTPHVASIFEGYYPWVVTIVTPLNAEGEECWVALDISFSSISTYINDVGIGQHGYCFIMNDDGNIIYHPQQQLIYSELKEENTELISALPDGSQVEGNVIYIVSSLENSRWRVVGVSFMQELISDSVREIAGILALVLIVIFIAALIISLVLSITLSRPVHGLAAAMQQFEQDADNFSYQPVGGAREVQNLSESFGHMVLQIQQLMATVRSEEVNLRKTELRALQAQINPHFLYNTLDSIAWMCEQGRNDEAVKMVNALARLFRISISRGQELIPIRSELQHAESYLQIQAYRYKNHFSYRFEVEESCLDFFCNKITLQPIIENAIYHGINGLVDEGVICISVFSQDEDVIFTVEDNGMGMAPEQVEAILSKERSDHAGIGIKNVNDRLKIYFGTKYGIEISSVPDEGTKVTIRMPKVREGAEYEKR